MNRKYEKRAKTQLKNYNSILFLASDKGKFILTKNKKIIARIYEDRNVWYIWYEVTCHRQEIKNFSIAIKKLEEEFENE